MEEALSPQVQCLDRVGGKEFGVSRCEVLGGSVSLQAVGELSRGRVVKGFVCDEENLKLYSLLDGEPVELLEDWG